MATRRAFNPSDDEQIAAPAPSMGGNTYRCFADGCSMPGSIFLNSGRTGTCAWHYGALPSDLPRITQVLKDWECLTFEVRAARAALSGDKASDPKALHDLFVEAQGRVLAATNGGGWGDTFKPKPVEDYRTWALRLGVFVSKRIHQTLGYGATQ